MDLILVDESCLLVLHISSNCFQNVSSIVLHALFEFVTEFFFSKENIVGVEFD